MAYLTSRYPTSSARSGPAGSFVSSSTTTGHMSSRRAVASHTPGRPRRRLASPLRPLGPSHTYLTHGRIAVGSHAAMSEEALCAWRTAREKIRRSWLVVTGDNASADELS